MPNEFTPVSPELFADNVCGTPLPAGETMQRLRFGQLCPLIVTDGANDLKAVLGDPSLLGEIGTTENDDLDVSEAPRQPLALRMSRSPMTSTAPDATLTGPLSPITFSELLEGKRAERPMVHQVAEKKLSFSAIGSIIEGGKVTIDDEQHDVELNPEILNALLKGNSTIAHVKRGNEFKKVFLVPEERGHSADFGKLIEVHPDDILDVLSFGHVLDAALTPHKFEIETGGFKKLMSNRSCKITIGSQKVRLVLRETVSDALREAYAQLFRQMRGDKEEANGGSKGPATPQTTSTPVVRPQEFGDVSLAILMPWTQEWVLKGFSRGRLIQTIGMAPQEETMIELFTWDRRNRSLEQSSFTETEQSIENEDKSQDVQDIVTEMSKERSFELKANGSFDLTASYGAVKVQLGAQVSADQKSNAKDLAKANMKRTREQTNKAVAKVRSQRTSKIVETVETGTESRVTRRLRNPNQCHSLNLDFFEVLTHYRVKTAFDKEDMRFCAMVRNPLIRDHYDAGFLRRHEQALSDALLDRSLRSGFEALRFLRAREFATKELEARRLRKAARAVVAPVVDTPANNSQPQVQPTPEETALLGCLQRLGETAAQVFSDQLQPDTQEMLRYVCGRNESEAPGIYASLKGKPPAEKVTSARRFVFQQLFVRYFGGLADRLAKGVAAKLEDAASIASQLPAPTAVPPMSQLSAEEESVKRAPLEGAIRDFKPIFWDWDTFWWPELRRLGVLNPDDVGLISQLDQFGEAYRAYLEAASRQSLNSNPVPPVIAAAQGRQDELSDEDRLQADFPLAEYSRALERAEVLISHINHHRMHYAHSLFMALPPDEQAAYIDAQMQKLRTAFPIGFYTPIAISQIGPFLLVPIQHEQFAPAANLLAEIKSTISIPAEYDDTILPAAGMTVETRLGQCTGCEDFIMESRATDLRLRKAEAAKAEQEAERLKLRLSQKPPLLDLEHPPGQFHVQPASDKPTN